jgi:hypothetical protein
LTLGTCMIGTIIGDGSAAGTEAAGLKADTGV